MDGIERIKKLAEGQKDKPLLKVVEYLLSRTDMNEKYLNEEKNLKGMIIFIRMEAKKQAVNGVAMIEDEVVYGWAIHYFDESNKDLGLTIENDAEAEEITVPKIENKAIIKKEKNIPDYEQLTLF